MLSVSAGISQQPDDCSLFAAVFFRLPSIQPAHITPFHASL